MVTKTKVKTAKKQGKAKVGKLRLNRETVKSLTEAESKKLRGGLRRQASAISCAPTCDGSITCFCSKNP